MHQSFVCCQWSGATPATHCPESWNKWGDEGRVWNVCSPMGERSSFPLDPFLGEQLSLHHAPYLESAMGRAEVSETCVLSLYTVDI